MRKLIIFGALFLSFSVANTLGQTSTSDAETRMAMANFLDEMVKCTSYFSILGQGTNSKGEQTEININYQKLAENLAITSLNFAAEIGMKSEALLSKLQGYSDEMGKLINNDGINISILIEKHGKFCKSFVENPRDRLLFWMNE